MSIGNILLLCVLVLAMFTILVLSLSRDRIVAERVRRKVERLRREEAEGVPPSPRDYEHRIDFDDQSISVTNLRDAREPPTSMHWSDIQRAVVFKRDCFTFDCICLVLFRTDATGIETVIELNEEMARWNSLIESLPKHLPGCLAFADWFSKVAFPACETNATEIFSRG